MIVLDGSAALELVLSTKRGEFIAEITRAHKASVHAPHLIELEIAHTLRKFLLVKDLSLEQAEAALRAWQGIDVTRHTHMEFLWPLWRHRHNLTAYDAVYVALAEALGAMLVTCDGRLARAPGLDIQIEVVR